MCKVKEIQGLRAQGLQMFIVRLQPHERFVQAHAYATLDPRRRCFFFLTLAPAAFFSPNVGSTQGVPLDMRAQKR